MTKAKDLEPGDQIKLEIDGVVNTERPDGSTWTYLYFTTTTDTLYIPSDSDISTES